MLTEANPASKNTKLTALILADSDSKRNMGGTLRTACAREVENEQQRKSAARWRCALSPTQPQPR